MKSFRMQAIGIFLFVVILAVTAQAQVKVSTSPAVATPHSSAMLEIESSSKGLLLPRMSTSARNAIMDPAQGLLVYDSTLNDFFFYNGGSWIRIRNFNSGGNTLNQAYNEGGPGAGRIISAISGAVEINNTGQNHSLWVRNTTNRGIDLMTTTGAGIFLSTTDGHGLDVTTGRGTAVNINKTDSGYGIRAFTSMNKAKDLVSISMASIHTGNFLKPDGRAGYFAIDNLANSLPALQGNTIGSGHGVAGITGAWPSVTNLVAPRSGVLGLSFLTYDRRNGVAGYSRNARGVQGITGTNTGWALPNIDSMQSGVFGRADFSPDNPSSVEDAIFAGVIGRVPSGFGGLGVSNGYGHGVIGVTKGDNTTRSQAGIWGLVRDSATWLGHTTNFPFADATYNKGRVGVLGQTNTGVAIWGESRIGVGLVGTSGRKQGIGSIGAFKAGVMGLSTNADGLAAVFSADTTINPTVLINSKSELAGLEMNQILTGKAMWIKKMKTGHGIHLEMLEPTNAGPGILVEQFGLGYAAEFNNLRVTSPTAVLRSYHAGLGRVADFEIGNLANMDNVMVAKTNGRGGAGIFNIVRPDAEPIKNAAAALQASTNALGSAAFFAVTNMAAFEPGVELISLAGKGLYIQNLNDTVTATTNRLLSNGRGYLLNVEGLSTLASSKAALHVESLNGFTAHFDQKSTVASRAEPAVLISTVLSAAGHTALKITTPGPCTDCYAAKMEGKLEVAKDTKIGGKLDVDGKTTIDDAFEVKGTSKLDGAVTATSGMSVTGALSITGLCAAGSFSANAKLFRINHPLDEANKILQHACTESNEHLVQYSGNMRTDADGYAKIEMPNYVPALAKNFRYQLTVVEKVFAQAIVYEPMANGNKYFVIKTDKPGIMISWQVTGQRQDRYVLENPLVVEQHK